MSSFLLVHLIGLPEGRAKAVIALVLFEQLQVLLGVLTLVREGSPLEAL